MKKGTSMHKSDDDDDEDSKNNIAHGMQLTNELWPGSKSYIKHDFQFVKSGNRSSLNVNRENSNVISS